MHLLGWKDTFVKQPSEKQEQEFPGKMGNPNKTPMQTNGLTLGFKQNSNAFCCWPHVKWVYPLQIQHWCFQAASLMSDSLDSASFQTAHQTPLQLRLQNEQNNSSSLRFTNQFLNP